MNTENKTTESGSNKFLQYRTAIIIGVVTLAAIGAVLWLALTGGDKEVEVYEDAARPAGDINVAQVIDAIQQKDAVARAGYRYKVVIEDESKTGTAGIARIGGLVIFVEGTPAVGDVLIVEVTQMRATTANAVIVEKVGTMEVPKRAAGRGRSRETSIDGKVYSGIIEDVGSKGDGIIHIDGKVVFVEGSTKGQDVTFIITYEGDRFSSGQLVTAEEAEQLGGEIVKIEPGKGRSPDRRDSGSRRAPPADSPVKVGQAYRGVVDDMGSKGDGIVHVQGKVVFIPGTSKGDEIVFIVEDDGPRVATGRKISAEEAEGLQVEDVAVSAAPKKSSKAAPKSSGGSVVVGETYSGTVEDVGSKGDGIVRIDGKVVFIPGAEKGQSVTFKVTEDKGRTAIGALVPAE